MRPDGLARTAVKRMTGPVEPSKQQPEKQPVRREDCKLTQRLLSSVGRADSQQRGEIVCCSTEMKRNQRTKAVEAAGRGLER